MARTAGSQRGAPPRPPVGAASRSAPPWHRAARSGQSWMMSRTSSRHPALAAELPRQRPGQRAQAGPTAAPTRRALVPGGRAHPTRQLRVRCPERKTLQTWMTFATLLNVTTTRMGARPDAKRSRSSRLGVQLREQLIGGEARARLRHRRFDRGDRFEVERLIARARVVERGDDGIDIEGSRGLGGVHENESSSRWTRFRWDPGGMLPLVSFSVRTTSPVDARRARRRASKRARGAHRLARRTGAREATVAKAERARARPRHFFDASASISARSPCSAVRCM